MATPVRIQSGDAEYAELYALWVAEGCPAQFDSMGAEGGHLYYATERRSGTPVFHVMASAGPTLYDDNSTGGPTQEGWIAKMPRHGQLTFTRDFHTGQLKVKKDPLPRE